MDEISLDLFQLLKPYETLILGLCTKLINYTLNQVGAEWWFLIEEENKQNNQLFQKLTIYNWVKYNKGKVGIVHH